MRRANKLLSELTTNLETLPSKKMYSAQQIDDQKLRFVEMVVSLENMVHVLVGLNKYLDSLF